MTIQDNPTVLSYAGNGVTTEFTTPYFVNENTIIAVKVNDITGEETTLDFNIDYLLDDEGLQPNGKLITLLDHEIETGYTLFITRVTPLDQETDYTFNDNFDSEANEEALDKLTTIDQQQEEVLGRCLKTSEYHEGQYAMEEGSEPLSVPVDGCVLFCENNVLKVKMPDGMVYLISLTEEM